MIAATLWSRLLAGFFVTTFHDFLSWYFERGLLLYNTERMMHSKMGFCERYDDVEC